MKKDFFEYNEKNSNHEDFDAYQYAPDFEKLSLEIIIYKEELNTDIIIDKDITQKTRDKGVDAYIVLMVNGTYSTYTIEAKLRTGETLSLKDFATSILYCLINTSSKHFIVTNVSFSEESIKYIYQSNNRKNKKIELVDGEIIKKIINQHLASFQNYPRELIQYILSKKLQHCLNISYQDKKCEILYDKIYFESFQANLQKATDLLDIGTNLIIVKGHKGVGKHTWIEMFCQQENVISNYSIYTIDLLNVQTPRLLIIEFLRYILGIDIDRLFHDLDNTDQFVKTLFDDMQCFEDNSSRIINALRYLLDKRFVENDEYIYMMHILMTHIYENFLKNDKTLIVVENLHLMNEKMVKFTLDLIQCICKTNVIFILNLLIPLHKSQTPFIEMEQWFGYIKAVEQYSRNNTPIGEIVLKNMSEPETVKAIKYFLNTPSLTNEYYNEFIEYFGTNPAIVFNVLKIIKNKKIFSSTMLKTIKENTFFVENYLSELLDYNNVQASFFSEIFVFIYLLDGKIEECVLNYLDEKYSINSRLLLIQKGVIDERNFRLSIPGSYFNTIKQLMLIVNVSTQKQCAKWLLDNIHSLNIKSSEEVYYNIRFLYVFNPLHAMQKINEAIKNLNINQLYSYSIKLAELRYMYYKQTNHRLLYYENLVIYISYIIKHYTSMTAEIEVLFREAEYLKKELCSQFGNNDDYISSNLTLALNKYYHAKNQYDYSLCEENIKYILTYENSILRSDTFALARIYMALIKKEQGLRNQFIIELIYALKKYPNNKEVKVSYYANLAAMYKFKNISISIKLLELVQKITYDDQKGHGDLWSKIDMFQYFAYCNSLKLCQIIEVRQEVERKNSLNNLARTYNLEGYYHYSEKELLIAKECLETAIFHSLSSGQGKQYFLFTLNLLHILLMLNENCDKQFYNAYKWFQKHREQIIHRLHNNPYRKTDHMYAALVSLVCIIKKRKQFNLLKTLEVKDILPELLDTTNDKLTSVLPPFYIKNNIIFILF